MTEQTPTAAFNAQPYMGGVNADSINQLAARHAAAPRVGLCSIVSVLQSAWLHHL